jgi:hypothetical protein
VLGALVVSHWVLDWITHVPDLPLYPGGAVYGLSAWRVPPITFAIEVPLFVLGVWLYASRTRGRDRAGRIGFWGLLGFMAAAYVGSLIAPPPPTASAVAWGALSAWLLPLLGVWVDRHRERVTPAVTTAS